jgi:hypothetical protein
MKRCEQDGLQLLDSRPRIYEAGPSARTSCERSRPLPRVRMDRPVRLEFASRLCCLENPVSKYYVMARSRLTLHWLQMLLTSGCLSENNLILPASVLTFSYEIVNSPVFVSTAHLRAESES